MHVLLFYEVSINLHPIKKFKTEKKCVNTKFSSGLRICDITRTCFTQLVV